MKNYKFIHVFNENDIKFIPKIVEMINDESACLQGEDHLFVTPHKRVYDIISKNTNTICVEKKLVYIINEYAAYCEWLFVHGMPPLHEGIFINSKYCSKIVWRTWGHDVGYSYREGEYIQNVVKHLIEMLWINKVKKIYAVGTANVVDEIDIKKRFGVHRLYTMPYLDKKTAQIRKQIIDNVDSKENTNVLRILLGHSGYSNDNHLEILNKILKYKQENILVYLVLSYGDQDYIEQTKMIARELMGDKVIIIDEFIEYEKYVQLLSDVDVAILDGQKSYALGNISLLLFFGKKIFVNRMGVIKKAFDLENIPYCCTDEIDAMPFENFAQNFCYDKIKTGLLPRSYEECVDEWRKLLEDLQKKS